MNHADRSSEQIHADIQRTRSDLDRTLTLLERRLEPRRLMDQGIDYLRDNGASEYLSNLGRAAKEQPLPLALVGVGLAWMMMTNGRAGGSSMSSRIDGRSMGDAMGDAASEAGSRAREGMDALRSRASELGGAVSNAMSQTRDAAHRTSQSLSDAADATRARAAQVSEATRRGAEKLRSGYDQLVNEQPLALGAIGLALGAVLAAAAPRTRQEDEWMGSSSDRLKDDAMRAGEDKLQEVKRAVTEGGRESGTDASDEAATGTFGQQPQQRAAQQQGQPAGNYDKDDEPQEAAFGGGTTYGQARPVSGSGDPAYDLPPTVKPGL